MPGIEEFKRLPGIKEFLKKVVRYRRVITVGCQEKKCYYRRLPGIEVLLQRVARYRRVITEGC